MKASDDNPLNMMNASEFFAEVEPLPNSDRVVYEMDDEEFIDVLKPNGRNRNVVIDFTDVHGGIVRVHLSTSATASLREMLR
jgi:hypothetical protein